MTEAGERLRIRIGHTMDELRSLLNEFDDEASLRRGRVSIGASATVSAGVLGAAVTRFRAQRPHVEIVVFDDFFGRAMDRLARGEVDFAFLPFDPKDELYNFESLFVDPFVLAVASNHHLARRRTVALGDLRKETFVNVPRRSEAWEDFRHEYATSHRDFQPTIQTRNPFAVLAMIKAGAGVGFLPEMLAETVNLDGIVLLHVREKDLNRQIGVATPKGRALSPATTAFLETLRDEAKKWCSNSTA